MEDQAGGAAEFRSPANWAGLVGMSLGGQLYLDLAGDVQSHAMHEKVDELTTKILRLNDHHWIERSASSPPVLQG